MVNPYKFNNTFIESEPTSVKSEGTIFREITEEMAKTFEKKNADYGNSFFEDLDDDGLVSSKIMLRHKFSRFSNLIRQGHIQQVKDESIEDTLLDMANYAILTVMWMRSHSKNRDI